MRPNFAIICFSLLTIASCCPKKHCDLQYQSATLIGFTAQEIDTVRIITRDMEGTNAPDTLFSEGLSHTAFADTSFVSAMLPFDERNSYEFYLPALGRAYLVDNYELTRESCNTCFPSAASGEYYDVLQAYEVNGVRRQGATFTITK